MTPRRQRRFVRTVEEIGGTVNSNIRRIRISAAGRIATSRFAPFVFQAGVDQREAARPLQRVGDAAHGGRYKPLRYGGDSALLRTNWPSGRIG